MSMLKQTHVEDRRSVEAVLRARIARLEGALLDEEERGKALRDSEKRYRRLFESAKDGILILDAGSGRVVDVNPFLLQLLGYAYEALVGQFIWELGVFKDIAASKDAFAALQDNEYIRYDDLPLETRDGRAVAVEFVSNVYLVDESKVIQCNIRDITARKWADAERKRLMAALEQTGEVVFMTDAQGITEFVNPAFERTTGYGRSEAIGRNPRFLKSGEQDDEFYRGLWRTISGGSIWAGRIVNARKDGTRYTAETTISPVRDASGRIANYVTVQRDITDQLRLAAQFQQAQKMEAVGLLAGGVAHDFNNMLSVILGYSELALGMVDPTQALHTDLQEIHKAAIRSTDITRQLLAFARKQTIVPAVLDLNHVVDGMLKMLRRLIGEDIRLVWLPAEGPCTVKIDPAQVDQILANLCVNSRDAIADVGTVRIETGVAVLDEAYCAGHPGAVAGEYVRLVVSDDGRGIDKEIIDQVFVPFFTRKRVGEGTGLGLSTVYGIVTQNGGFIDVSSEPGRGTTFTIHLPRYAGAVVDARGQDDAMIPRGGGETVLVVEDEAALLAMDRLILEKLGYRVLTAGTPDEAIARAGELASGTPLLLTDVVMPGMNGRDLAERMRALHPGLKVLFMSSHSAEVIAHRGVLDEGVCFIQKPFTLRDLAVKVRAMMGDGPGASERAPAPGGVGEGGEGEPPRRDAERPARG